MEPTILLVDDDDSLREVTEYHLSQAGYRVFTAKNGMEALDLFSQHKPDVVVTDIAMPEMDGVQLLTKIKSMSEETMVIMITAYGSIESVVEAMQMGACDYIEKPFSSEALKLSVEKALRVARLEKENRYLRQVAQEKFRFENIVGTSKKMQQVYSTSSLVAHRDTTVLLLGESGTGKELLAKAIHFNSKNKGGPFVAVNMGAIPENLVDSELFGHEKGSFTGAASRHAGAFERAHGGTLFLDEISEMRPDHQIRLLRVLQDREITRVGSESPIKVNVRVIAATNRDLEQMVGDGEFREDLYYRLCVIPITLPPLRERRDDIPLLVDHFLQKYCNETGIEQLKISDEAMRLLMAQPWPGNVRELENTIERCVAMNTSSELTPDCLPEKFRNSTVVKNTLIDLPDEGIVLDDVEKEIIKAALTKNNYNQSATARFLGITRNTLLYRMEKYGLKQNSDGSGR
ncbi:MAG: sigma-54 dependent transcriptional regulator [bacterium]